MTLTYISLRELETCSSVTLTVKYRLLAQVWVFLIVFQNHVSMFSSRNVCTGDGPLPTDSSSHSIYSSRLKMLSVAAVSFAKPV